MKSLCLVWHHARSGLKPNGVLDQTTWDIRQSILMVWWPNVQVEAIVELCNKLVVKQNYFLICALKYIT